MTSVTSEQVGTRPTLGEVLANLGPSVASVIVAPKGLDVPAGPPVIYDPTDAIEIEPEAIVLAIGVQQGDSKARELVEQASGATAILMKLHGDECSVAQDAERNGIAILSVPDEVGWGHLHALLTGATSLSIAHPSLEGLGSVPMGDLFALANAIAATTGGAVTIEGPHTTRVLAYSNLEGQAIDELRQMAILGRQSPDVPGIRALYKRLWSSEGVIRVEEIEGIEIRPRIAIAVRVGTETLGSIWVVEGETRLGEEAERVLGEAGRVAALHIIQSRSSHDLERRIRGDLLRLILDGRIPPATAASRLGIDPDSTLVILGFQLPSAPRAEEELQRERMVDLVSLYCEAFRHRAPCAAVGRNVYAVLPTKRINPEWLTKLASDILQQAEATLHISVRAAIGPPAKTFDELPKAREEVDLVLRALGLDRKGIKIGTIEDVRNEAILILLRDLAVDNRYLSRGTIEEIAAHDAAKRTDYLPTLKAYVESNGDIVEGARLLDVHQNTFRYRLRRVQAMFGVDLSDPDERFVIELQVRLLGDGNVPAGQS